MGVGGGGGWSERGGMKGGMDGQDKMAAITLVLGSTILYLRSVDPRKLCVGVQYYMVHMYSMPYYTYGSTANSLFLEPTALIYI